MANQLSLKWGFAALSIGIMASCGGGGETTSSASNPTLGSTSNSPSAVLLTSSVSAGIAWASAGVFVTPGQSSKSFALRDCQRWGATLDQLFNASLRIESTGAVSLWASESSSGPITSLFQFDYAEPTNMSWRVDGTTLNPRYELSMSRESRNHVKSLYVKDVDNATQGGSDVNTNMADRIAGVNHNIRCNLNDPLTLQIAIDSARAVQNIGTPAGITRIDQYITAGTIANGVAQWSIPSGTSAYKHLRFDLTNGAFSSSSLSSGPFSAINLSLPSGSVANINGGYGEAVQRLNAYYDYQEAKLLCLSYSDNNASSGFSITATGFGDLFFPRDGFHCSGDLGVVWPT